MNAVIYKRYESGIPIQISVYKDKLYIANKAILPNNWTVENLYEKHVSKPYNPKVTHIFYFACLIESWGHGVEITFVACKRDNLPFPMYHVNQSDIMIQFNALKEMIVEDFIYMINKSSIQKNNRLTEKELQVLELLYEDSEYTTNEISLKLNITRRIVLNRLKSLKRKKVIERIESDRKGYWIINHDL